MAFIPPDQISRFIGEQAGFGRLLKVDPLSGLPWIGGRPGIAFLMRRLLTGYAVSYNPETQAAWAAFPEQISVDNMPGGCLFSGIGSVSDQRILGEREFVMDILSESEGHFSRRYRLKRFGYDYEKVLEKVSEIFHLEKEYITGKGETTGPGNGEGFSLLLGCG